MSRDNAERRLLARDIEMVGMALRVLDGLDSRAALKGTNPRGQTPICGFLRVPVLFYGFLRNSAVFCENLFVSQYFFSKKRQGSAKICENLRLGSVCPLSFVRGLGLGPGRRSLRAETPKV